jgi:hypothetical protein
LQPTAFLRDFGDRQRVTHALLSGYPALIQVDSFVFCALVALRLIHHNVYLQQMAVILKADILQAGTYQLYENFSQLAHNMASSLKTSVIVPERFCYYTRAKIFLVCHQSAKNDQGKQFLPVPIFGYF